MQGCFRWVRMCVVALSLLALAAPAAAQVRRVVLLYDERTELPGLAVLDAALVRTLQQEMGGSVEVYREAMELSRFPSPRHPELLRGFLAAKYAGKPIHVVVAVIGPALEFMLAHGAEVFPGARIVFCGIDRRDLQARRLPAGVTGVLLKREFAPTLELALRLHPGTQRVLFVAGSSPFDHRLREAAAAEFRHVRTDVPIEYVTGRPLPALLRTVATLPPRSIVLYSTMFADSLGASYVPHQVAERIAASANAPVYAFVDQLLGRGIVGGHLYSLDAHGEQAARLAVRILRGEAASTMPPVEGSISTTQFDWRQLRRWHVSERRLPAGSSVRFRELPMWERHRGTIAITAGVVLLQLVLIVALLVERRIRRRAEVAHRDSEARAQIAGVSLGVGFWTWDPERDRLWLSEQCARLLGLDHRSATPLHEFLKVMRPPTDGLNDDAFAQAFRGDATFDGEWELADRGDGARSVAGAVRTIRDTEGGHHVTGALIDVTERRAAERLATEQRRELTHLGRVALVGELSGTLAHELNQPLSAILANAVAAQHTLRREVSTSSELVEILDDIAADSRRAGAVIARVRGLVRKTEAEQQLVSVNEVVEEVLALTHSDLISRGVTAETQLAEQSPLVRADRVQLQQVLLNLIMNAGDAMAETPRRERMLLLRTTLGDDGVRVEVQDRGCGIPAESIESVFAPFVTTKSHGLGLGLAICRSIVSSHGGTLQASNNADRGATFVVTLPLAGRARARPTPAGGVSAPRTLDAVPSPFASPGLAHPPGVLDS